MGNLKIHILLLILHVFLLLEQTLIEEVEVVEAL